MASAVPLYQFSSMRCCGGSTSMYSAISRLRKLQPAWMWRLRLRALYCVSTRQRRSSLLTQLDSVKSTMRYSPPNGTAGLARSRVSGSRRVPLPPARIRVRTSFTVGHLLGCRAGPLPGGRTAREKRPPRARLTPPRPRARTRGLWSLVFNYGLFLRVAWYRERRKPATSGGKGGGSYTVRVQWSGSSFVGWAPPTAETGGRCPPYEPDTLSRTRAQAARAYRAVK